MRLITLSSEFLQQKIGSDIHPFYDYVVSELCQVDFEHLEKEVFHGIQVGNMPPWHTANPGSMPSHGNT